MSASLKLISLNIERSKHLDLVIPFVQKSAADAVCMLEVCEQDIGKLESSLAMRCVFGPTGYHPADSPDTEPPMVGSALFTRLPMLSSQVMYYAGSEHAAHMDEPRTIMHNLKLIIIDVEKDGRTYRLATTHFGWTPDGYASDEQRHDLGELFKLLDLQEEFVLAGDFNAPREIDGKTGEIFSAIATRYKDNIPPRYVTSLDRQLHRVGYLDRMVDGLFTTPQYQASDVELVSGVSDHCAIVATITKSE